MKKYVWVIKKIFIIITSIITYIFFMFPNQVKAVEYNNGIVDNDITIVNSSIDNALTRANEKESVKITGKTYYIKNMLTGQYLDVKDGIAADGTIVRQYKFNGTDAQKWRLHYWGNGVYGLLSALGNDGTYKYALDVQNGSSNNFANVQLWSWNTSNAQQFSLVETNYGTYGFKTKSSNYEKIITLVGETYDQETQIVQATPRNYAYNYWILEPVSRDKDLGIKYARTNYNQYVQAYPNLTEFNGKTADCANFVSQCLLASGKHYDGNWKIYRKDGFTYKPKNVEELDSSWELCQPNTSPWISAKEFGDYWRTKTKPEYYTVNYILDNPDKIFNKDYYRGDVLQVAVNNLGFLAESFHTMYVTDYNEYNGKESYALTYHSNSQVDRNLLEICQAYKNQGKNYYIVFFDV